MRDWREIMGAPVGVTGLRNHTHNPQNPESVCLRTSTDASNADIADIAYGKREAGDGASDRGSVVQKVAEVAATQSRSPADEANRVARLDADRHERDKATAAAMTTRASAARPASMTRCVAAGAPITLATPVLSRVAIVTTDVRILRRLAGVRASCPTAGPR
jgi:hypothetical protein